MYNNNSMPNYSLPSQYVPNQQDMTQQMPMQQMPMPQMPMPQMPMQQMPMQQMPMQQMPMQQMPMQQMPMQQMPQGPTTQPFPTTPVPPPVSAPVYFEQLPQTPVMSIDYTQGYLKTQIGKRVKVEFLLGTNTYQDRDGTLLYVGISYILLQETETNNTILCDIYSIKFVVFYQ